MIVVHLVAHLSSNNVFSRSSQLIFPLRAVVFLAVVVVVTKFGVSHVVVISVAPRESHFLSPVTSRRLWFTLEACPVCLELSVENFSLCGIGVIYLAVLDAWEQVVPARSFVVRVIYSL